MRHRMQMEDLTRRELLSRCAGGFGGLALAAMAAEEASASAAATDPLTVRAPHFAGRAKSVILLYMDGGPSQVDTFDYKPRLERERGRPIGMKIPPTQFNNVGTVMPSPWTFRPRGRCGTQVSDLIPNIATCVDELAVIRSMVSDNSEHTSANYLMHTGFSMQGRPSMGSWITYGLGSACRNLPGFIVLDSGWVPTGGMDNFGCGFLPASYQGTLFRKGPWPVADIQPRESSVAIQKEKLGLARRLNRGVMDRLGSTSELEATIANYELAFRMQAEVPDLIDLGGESAATLRLYGIGEPQTETYGRQCLLARRLVERGVRFLEVVTPLAPPGVDRWDQHDNLYKGHLHNATSVDKPVSGLIKDLKARGLLEETLVIWAAEFGRTPMAQGANGRDHNPYGYSIFLAGGGVKGGIVHGSTDEYGYYAIENKVHVHDLHATILHLLGLDHTRLTYRFNSRDMRLTDVHGEVVDAVIA